MQSIRFRFIVILVISAFLMHLFWENTQAPLYAGYSSFGQQFPMCFFATIGDVIFTVLVYLGIGLLKKDFEWIARINKRDIFVLATVGFFYAVGIEWRALLFAQWNYALAMPIIPWFNVGLTPIIQMTMLLPFSFYLARVFNKKSYEPR